MEAGRNRTVASYRVSSERRLSRYTKLGCRTQEESIECAARVIRNFERVRSHVLSCRAAHRRPCSSAPERGAGRIRYTLTSDSTRATTMTERPHSRATSRQGSTSVALAPLLTWKLRAE